MGKRERIKEMDFIRAICTLGIIVHHFSTRLMERFSNLPFMTVGNGSWGNIFVAVFFLLSGAALYLTNKEIKKDYFIKRAKKIYPMFWVAFLIIYIRNMSLSHVLFYKGNPLKLILSALGIDGYFYYRIDNYYILGEWFLGAVILLYLLYPILLWGIEKHEVMCNVFVLCIYAGVYWTYIRCSGLWKIYQCRNLLVCMFSFWIGMILMKHREEIFKDYKFLMVGIVLVFFAYFVPLGDLMEHMMALGLFFVLWYIGSKIMRYAIVEKMINQLSFLSYPIFLVHHVLIEDICNAVELNITSYMRYSIVLFGTVVLCIIFAWGLNVIGDEILGLDRKRKEGKK